MKKKILLKYYISMIQDRLNGNNALHILALNPATNLYVANYVYQAGPEAASMKNKLGHTPYTVRSSKAPTRLAARFLKNVNFCIKDYHFYFFKILSFIYPSIRRVFLEKMTFSFLVDSKRSIVATRKWSPFSSTPYSLRCCPTTLPQWPAPCQL